MDSAPIFGHEPEYRIAAGVAVMMVYGITENSLDWRSVAVNRGLLEECRGD